MCLVVVKMTFKGDFMENEKIVFLKNQFWNATIGAAFQRAKLYVDNSSEKQKKAFRQDLKVEVESIAELYKKRTISDSEHIINIEKLVKFSSKYKSILNDDKLKFGVAQKVLNLYLKYLWCHNYIKEPPHFPLDRTIQVKFKLKTIVSWTKIDNSQDYLKIISKIKEKAKDKNISLASIELIEFNND